MLGDGKKLIIQHIMLSFALSRYSCWGWWWWLRLCWIARRLERSHESTRMHTRMHTHAHARTRTHAHVLPAGCAFWLCCQAIEGVPRELRWRVRSYDLRQLISPSVDRVGLTLQRDPPLSSPTPLQWWADLWHFWCLCSHQLVLPVLSEGSITRCRWEGKVILLYPSL